MWGIIRRAANIGKRLLKVVGVQKKKKLQVVQPKKQNFVGLRPTQRQNTLQSGNVSSYAQGRSGKNRNTSSTIQRGAGGTRRSNTGAGVQGSTSRGRTFSQPRQPKKIKRSWTETVYDKPSNSFKKITKAGNLTDKEWTHVQAVAQKKRNYNEELAKKREKYKDEFKYKSDLASEAADNSWRKLQQATREREKRLEEIGQLAQSYNDADNYDEALKLYKQHQAKVAELESWQIDTQQDFQAYQEAVQSELDKSGLFKDTRGLFDKVVKAPLKGAWNLFLRGASQPKRVVNTWLNKNAPNRPIYKEDATTTSTGKRKTSKNWFQDWRHAYNASEDQLIQRGATLGKNDTGWTWGARATASGVLENIFDPANYLGGDVVRKGFQVYKGSKWGSKAIAKFDDIKSVVKNTKLGGWLTDDWKTLSKRRKDFVIDELEDIGRKSPAARKLAEEWRQNSGTIKASTKANFVQEVQNDFSKFSRSEVKAFQRYVRSGDDWAKVPKAAKLSDQVRSQIEDLSKKWRVAFNEMIDAEKKAGINVPYRQNYIPQYPRKFSLTGVNKSKNKMDGDWWFTKPQNPKTMGKKSFIKSMSARQYHSALARKDLPVLRDLDALGEDIGRNVDRLRDFGENPDKFVPKTLWEKATTPARAMGSLWRKSVLPFRPAWNVNNEISNQLFGLSGGGWNFIKNQRKVTQYLDNLEKQYVSKYGIKRASEMMSDIKSNIKDFQGYYDQSNNFFTKPRSVGGAKRAKYKDMLEKQGQGSWLTKNRKYSNLATAQENRARGALYRTFRQKGMDHDEAVKNVNDWLFDYTTKNWERPIRTALPFWNWQKNLAKRVATMPYKNPRAASAWSKTYKALYERPLNQLPDEQIITTDPDSGEKRVYNPREHFAGRIYNPFNNKWYNTPFNPFTPDSVANVGRNPLLEANDEWATNRDRWGNKLNDQKWWESIAKAFPQYNIGKNLWQANQVNQGILKPEDRWLARGSAFEKFRQGHDPSKDNYSQWMDPRDGLAADVGAYFGKPRGYEFDRDKFKSDKAYNDFNREWFSTDWDAVHEAAEKKEKGTGYDEMVRQQEKLAAKYDFNLQDDIYDGRWSRYDTDKTKDLKAMKSDARTKQKKFWDDYFKIPKGEKGKVSQRKIFVNQKRLDWEDGKDFIKNPYFGKVLQDWFIDEKKPNADTLVRHNTFWLKYFNAPESARAKMLANADPDIRQYVEKARAEGLAKYKASPKGRFWTKFFALSDDDRYDYYNKNWKPEFGGKSPNGKKGSLAEYRKSAKGQFWQQFFSMSNNKERLRFYAKNWTEEYGGDGLDDPQETLFWLHYYNSNPDERVRLLKDNPQYQSYDPQSLSSSDWEELRDRNREDAWKRAVQAKGFTDKQNKWKQQIERDVTRVPRASRRSLVWKV